MEKFIIILSFIIICKGFDNCDQSITLTAKEIINNNITLIATQVKINNKNNQVCFINKENNVKIGLKIIDEYDICEAMEILYFIPQKLNIMCDVYSYCNLFNTRRSDCELNDNDKFFSVFPHLKENNNGILRKGCQMISSDCFISDSAKWWYYKIYNENENYYSVSKCISTYKEIKLELSVISGTKRSKEILTIKNVNSDLTKSNIHNITLSLISSESNNIDILSKCFLKDSGNIYSMIDNCNSRTDNNVIGSVGEIKCYSAINAIHLNNCTNAFDLNNNLHNLNGNKIECNLLSLDYQKLFYFNQLPKSYMSFNAIQENNDDRIKFNYENQFIVVDIETNILLSEVRLSGTCKINLKNITIEGILNIKNSGKFNLSVIANNYYLVKFNCYKGDQLNIKETLVDKSYTYKNNEFVFNAYKNEINSYCEVYCNNDKLGEINIKGVFRQLPIYEKSLELHITSTSSEKKGDSDFLHALKEYILNSFFIKIIITIIFIIFTLIFSCMLFKLFIYCICKRKNNNEDCEKLELKSYNIISSSHKMSPYNKKKYLTSEKKSVGSDDEDDYLLNPMINLNFESSIVKNPKITTSLDTSSLSNIDISPILDKSHKTYYHLSKNCIKIIKDANMNPQGIFLNGEKITNRIPSLVFLNKNFKFVINDDYPNGIVYDLNNVIMISSVFNKTIILKSDIYSYEENIYFNKKTLEVIFMKSLICNTNLEILNDNYHVIDRSLYRKKDNKRIVYNLIDNDVLELFKKFDKQNQ